MKRIFLIFLIPLMLTSCSKTVTPKQPTEQKTTSTERVKAVWMTYYELQKFTDNSSEKQFKKKISSAFNKLKEFGFNTVTVQVRPFADAFYKSKYFPSSKYCFGREGSDMPFDPLEIICTIAQKHKLKIEAWINPYRVSGKNSFKGICKSNKARIWYNNKKTRSRVYRCKSGIYFNPASGQVRKLIISGVKEIAENYNISAIHFDDYFYPSQDKSIDKKEYKKYKAKGGKMPLADFRRECVNKLIKSAYKAVKKADKGIRFGISPAADTDNNRNALYADTARWASENGFVDYICPQVYFGFKNVYKPFMFTVKKWMYITNCDMYVGLPLYKANRADKYAALNDKEIINEFVNNSDIIKRQIVYLSKLDKIKGIYIFSFSSLFDKNCEKEVNNMLEALKAY